MLLGGAGLGGGLSGGLGGLGAKIAGVLSTPAVAIGGSVLGGLALGGTVYDNYVRPEGGATAGEFGAMGLTAGAKLLGDLFGKGEEWGRWMGELTGVIEKSGDAAQNAAGKLQGYQSGLENSPAQGQLVQEFDNYQKQQAALIEQYEAQKTQIVDQYGRMRTELEKQHEASRNQAIKAYERSNTQAWEDFYLNRGRQARAFEAQEAQAEREYAKQKRDAQRQLNLQLAQLTSAHNRTMQRMERDHRNRVEELTADRDALGLVQENRRYAQEKKDEEQRFAEEREENRAEYARQLKDLEEAFKEQQGARQAAYEQQMAEQLTDFLRDRERARMEHEQMLEELQTRFDERMKALEEEEAESLKKLQETQDKALRTMADAFVNRVRALDDQILGDYEKYTQHLEEIGGEFTQWLIKARSQFSTAMSGSSNTPRSGRANGGYVDYGTYDLGEAGYEFVLNHGTTRALERAAGGRLSQEAVLRGLVGRQSGGRVGGGMVINVNMPIGSAGSLNIQQRREIVRQARTEAVSGFVQALEMVG